MKRWTRKKKNWINQALMQYQAYMTNNKMHTNPCFGNRMCWIQKTHQLCICVWQPMNADTLARIHCNSEFTPIKYVTRLLFFSHPFSFLWRWLSFEKFICASHCPNSNICVVGDETQYYTINCSPRVSGRETRAHHGAISFDKNFAQSNAYKLHSIQTILISIRLHCRFVHSDETRKQIVIGVDMLGFIFCTFFGYNIVVVLWFGNLIKQFAY